MKIFVVNIYYDVAEQPGINRVFKLKEDGKQEEIIKEEIMYERSGIVVLVCKNETEIMQLLQAQICDRINAFELVSETDIDELKEMEERVEVMQTNTGGEAGEMEKIGELTGRIIFQIGI